MNYQGIFEHIVSLLKKDLAPHYHYHNLEHTLGVIEAAEKLAIAHSLSQQEIQILKTAALLHDTGFLFSSVDHEVHSCNLARDILPSYEYPPEIIEKICELIQATKVPVNPGSLHAQILCDADMAYLASGKYFEKTNKLKEELQILGNFIVNKSWTRQQLDFLESHQYYTSYAKEWYNPSKDEIVKKLSMKSKMNFWDTQLFAGTFGWIDILQMIVGILLAGLALKGFLVPNHFFDGGLTGISLLIHELYHFNLGLVIFFVNFPFIIISYYTVGKKFAIRTLLVIIMLGICLLWLPTLALTADKLLVSIFGGAFLGIGVGLIMRSGAALDGIEVLALFTLRKSSFKISEIIFAINVIIFIIAAIYFGVNTALYSILTYFTATRTIDYVVEGIRAHTGVTIVSAKSEEIKTELVNKLGKAITVYKGERGFLPGQFEVSEKCDIIFTVISRMEMRRVKMLVYAIDTKAFIFANTIKEASGGILTWKDRH